MPTNEINTLPDSPRPKNPKKPKKKMHPVKRILSILGTTIFSAVLIVIITAAIVATALTVYIMKYMDSNIQNVDIKNLDYEMTSFIYAYDKEAQDYVEVYRLSQNTDRILVTLDEVPQYVKDAFIYTEDERFYEHEGVNFMRTALAFGNTLLHYWSSEQGASTITQQLIKNVTGDDDPSIQRKAREIFTAMDVEKRYTKDEILTAYINYIGFGGTCSGIQAAAHKYYGKDVSELTLAEAASLAGTPKSPESINPRTSPEKNKIRQKEVLDAMLRNGVISDEEYDQAINEELKIVGVNKDVNADSTAEDDAAAAASDYSVGRNWFIDMAINDVSEKLMKVKGYPDMDAARTELASGGYKIYTTMDIDMQKTVESRFKDYTTFSSEVLTNPPQAAFIAMDYNGNIKAVVGGVGDKPGALCFNRATDSKRSIGSCIKPISTYGYAVSHDLINWSTTFTDTPIEVKDWENNKMLKWPKNYSNVWSGNRFFTFQALQRSLNTIPAQLCQAETPRNVFDFMQDNMQISSLVESDIDFSPMTVGALTNGISLKELVMSYQAFGSGGVINTPTSYSKVLDPDGNIVLESKHYPIQALDEDSAYVMNRLMTTVIEGPNGTGRAAKLATTELIGKTGTSQDWVDLAFVGCTPELVSGIWYGYDEQYKLDEKTGKYVANEARNTYYSSAQVWKNVFGDIADSAEKKTFDVDENVKELHYCTVTGLIAGPYCPQSTDVGYYKPSCIPDTCSGIHQEKLTSIAPSQAPVETLPPEATVDGAQTTTVGNTIPLPTNSSSSAQGGAPIVSSVPEQTQVPIISDPSLNDPFAN